MILGYARVSTTGQDLEGQLERLKAAGAEKVFHEKLSGANADRPQLQKMLKSLQPGDVVLATVTDRIARDPLDMLNIVKTVRDASAGLRLLDEPFIDTTGDLADVVIFLMTWAAKQHRKSILRNTEDGRKRAMADGRPFGPNPKLNAHQAREALARLEAGETTRAVALTYGVSHQTIGRLRTRVRVRRVTRAGAR